jgi:hypothetical protein
MQYTVPVIESSSGSRHTATLKAWEIVSGSEIIGDALKLDNGSGWVKVRSTPD